MNRRRRDKEIIIALYWFAGVIQVEMTGIVAATCDRRANAPNGPYSLRAEKCHKRLNNLTKKRNGSLAIVVVGSQLWVWNKVREREYPMHRTRNIYDCGKKACRQAKICIDKARLNGCAVLLLQLNR